MEAGTVDSSAENVYYKEGISLLEKFYKSNPPWNYNVVDMESRFEFEIDDPKTGEKAYPVRNNGPDRQERRRQF